MLKALTGLLHNSSSSEKEGIAKHAIKTSWQKTAKKLDAAIPRKRALTAKRKSIPTNVMRGVATGAGEKEKLVRKELSRKYFKIFTIKNKEHLLYEEAGKLFILRLDSKGFFKNAKEISLVNNFGYDVPLQSISEINVTQINDQLVLNYRKVDFDQQLTAFAELSDKLTFQEYAATSVIKHRFIFAKKEAFQEKYTAYTGENFIYFATANTLDKWEIQREHLLTPRQNFFDHNGVRIIETIATEKGVLLLYESSFVKDQRFYLQVGGALFAQENPSQLLWRCEKPIWEQSFPLTEADNASSIGAYYKDKNIFVYYVVAGELMRVDFRVPKFHTPKQARVTAIERHNENPILMPNLKNSWESKAVFNAAAIHANGKFHLLYRAIGDDDVSSLGYASSKDGFNFDTRLGFPIYVPREKFEGANCAKYDPCTDPAIYESGGGCSGGCEDPRLTKVGKTIYMTYVAYNGHDVPGVAMTSISYSDFIHQRWNWTKARLISKPGQIQKNWIVFPEKINGKYAIIHSITPQVMIDYFDNLDEEKVYIENSFRQTDTKENRWDNIVRGAGAPPIKTKYGWLLFYHAMDKHDPNRYKIGAMILDYKNPEKILYRSRVPLLEPDEIYENEGMKAGVVYVCGAVIQKDILHIYYGGADMVMCVASAKLDDFLEKMIEDKKTTMEKVDV
ncbi:MAG: hypothetical protein WC823_03990 [Parcubacteria group bacterium]|jgi:predicted GH43/DUF377 family glycosyl hydrolase